LNFVTQFVSCASSDSHNKQDIKFLNSALGSPLQRWQAVACGVRTEVCMF